MKFLKNLKNKPLHFLERKAIWNNDIFAVGLDNIDNDSIENYCFDLAKNHEGRHISNIGGFQYDLKEKNFKECNALANVVSQSTDIVNQIFKSEYGFKLKREIYSSGVWINLNYSNTYNTSHTHPGATYIGVYYVRTSGKAENGCISFSRPTTFELQSSWIDVCHEDELTQHIQIDIPPTKGMALFFPPWYVHQVLPNLDGYDRISIAMNFK